MEVIYEMRYKYLDVAKGITLLFVLMAHGCGFPFGLGSYCTAYFMALFFLISGYNQKNVELNRTCIDRRIKKIVFPYFTYNLLIYFIYAVWEGFEDIQDAWLAVKGIFYSSYCLYYPINTENNVFFYCIENNATWFLTAFFCSNIVFLFYMKYCKRVSCKIITILLFLVLTQILYYCPIFLPWNIDKAFIGAAFMIAGHEMKEKNIINIRNRWHKILWTILSVILYIFLVNINPGINLATREYGRFGGISAWIYFVIGVVGSLLCIWGSEIISRIPLLGRMLAELGREALAVMAMHLILYRIFDKMFLSKFFFEYGSIYYWGIAVLRILSVCMVIIGVVHGVQSIRKGRTKKINMG